MVLYIFQVQTQIIKYRTKTETLSNEQSKRNRDEEKLSSPSKLLSSVLTPVNHVEI